MKNEIVPGSPDSSDLTVMLRITAFSEATNSSQVTAVVVANRSATDRIMAGASATVFLTDGEEYSGATKIATILVNKQSLSRQLLMGETEPVVGSLVMYHKARPYPFDDYYSSINVAIRSGDFGSQPSIRLLKTVAGRTMRVDGNNDNFIFTLRRPRLQQIFVVLSGIVFMTVILGIAFRLLNSSAPENPVSQAFTVAGLLLGAAGFRDLLGLSKLASFSVADGFIIGIPLLVLAAAFFKTELSQGVRTTTLPKVQK